jgi:hypothetical protein
MGQRLVKLYEFARSAGGATAAMRLAMRTMISAEKAASADDSPENIARVSAAIKEVTGKDAPKV